jgi:hypothetical protein
MKKTIRLTEVELTNLINRIVSEQEFENTLYNDIMGLIRNSNSSHRETIDVLKLIVDEMESSKRVRRDVESRFKRNN